MTLSSDFKWFYFLARLYFRLLLGVPGGLLGGRLGSLHADLLEVLRDIELIRGRKHWRRLHRAQRLLLNRSVVYDPDLAAELLKSR